MGREKLYESIRKSAKGLLAGGIVLVTMFGLLAALLIAVAISEGDSSMIIGALVLLVIAGLCSIMIVKGVKLKKHPETHSMFKKNPDLLFQADELYKGIKYQDKFVILSERVVANAQNLTQMAFTNEVFMVYVYKQTTNFVTTTKQLILATARGEITLNIYGVKDDTINHIAQTVAAACPYARFGYNNENLNYLGQMRQVWDQKKTEQRMGISPQQKQQQAMQRQQAVQNGQQYNPDQTFGAQGGNQAYNGQGYVNQANDAQVYNNQAYTNMQGYDNQNYNNQTYNNQ